VAGLVKGARRKSGSNIVGQLEYLLDIAERTCAEFGTSLDNALRIQQFHTDLRELNPACQVWKRRLRGRPLPISAVQVPGPLLVPGCSVQLDLWIYVP
jgi:enamine deaminase RidA (YjgF/YER057c/UK114 family)